MKVILIIVAALAVVVVVQLSRIYKARTELAARVEQQLDLVDETSFDAVRSNLIHEAALLGIALLPSEIAIVYQDSAERSLPQKLLEGKVAAFQNKRVIITVRYNASVLGFPWAQQIERTKLRQVQVRAVRPGLEPENLPDPVF